MTKPVDFVKSLSVGVGQIVLQENALTGVLILIGIFYNSWQMGIGALAGVLAGTLAAIVLNFDGKKVKQGIYGFNGALVGLAIVFFYGLTSASAIALVAGAILSTVIMKALSGALSGIKLPPFTSPFVISTWLVMLAAWAFGIMQPAQAAQQVAVGLDVAKAITTGFGQVMLQENMITGAIFFAAILVNSKTSALYAFLGSALGIVVSLALGFPLGMINSGLFGFNGVLCGIAATERKQKKLLIAIVAITLSVLVAYGMSSAGIIMITAPFVISSWAALLLIKTPLETLRPLKKVS